MEITQATNLLSDFAGKTRVEVVRMGQRIITKRK
ncbi:hypothetical protein SAMN05444405_104151 [Bacteroides luti]|uniref:Uncharacterized protein n=1 Tax=Bacteroides luti TaxID=1297750 RepID=A0A1M4XWJ2_9BACE|nr:hypothetical protein SAMN05444405_104151 [Bacteroides luti]